MSLKHQEGPPESPRAADDFLKCPFFVCGKHSDVKKKEANPHIWEAQIVCLLHVEKV